MLFDRQVKKLIGAEGGEAPLAEVAARLAAADVAVGNLETTLAEGGTRTKVKEAKYAFRGHPDGVKGLSLAGFDAVSLANNHALDYGWEPLRDTIESLEDAGIGHAGAGKDTTAAWKPATIETTSGATVAYLAFSHVVPPGFLATDNRPGVASGKHDEALVKKAIKKAKKSHDYVIVSFHWGVEYVDDANADQVRRAHHAIDAGADMVLAHHPHVIQGVEFYNGRLIAYSLGDFVFDHYSRKTGEAFILEAELGPDGTASATAVPVYLDEHGRPEYVQGSHAKEILSRLKKISAKHGTTVELEGSIARITP
jgi:poly-gamma-glutamate synthesis protein (capsule biosynthesis protein)